MTTVVGLNVQEQLFSVKEGVPVPLSLHVSVPIISIQSVGQMVSNLMIFTYFTIEFLEFIFRYLIKLYILSFGCCLGVTYDNSCWAKCAGTWVECKGNCPCPPYYDSYDYGISYDGYDGYDGYGYGIHDDTCAFPCPRKYDPVCGPDSE